jgi:hypothetical protein
MPIPEPGSIRRSNLTKQQQQDQLAAIYGVTMPTQQLSEQEVAHMRQILAQHDSEHKPMQVFDLNNPPKEQYHFQKFPMMLYDHANSHPAYDEERPSRVGMGTDTFHVPAKVITLVVETEEQLQRALGDGWSEEAPEFRETPNEHLSAKLAAEAEKVQEQIDARRRGPGRPRKEVTEAA